MAIKVGGTEVVSDSRALNNIASVDATTAASITAAGVGGSSLATASSSGASQTVNFSTTDIHVSTLSSTTTFTFSNPDAVDSLTLIMDGTAAAAAWDVTTASLYSTAADYPDVDIHLQDIFFKPDGTEFFVCGASVNTVKAYTCSTPWDTSTFSVNSSKDGPTLSEDLNGLFFNDDGTKMYLLIDALRYVWEFDLGTPYDPSDALGGTTYSRRYYVGSQAGNPSGLAFSPDGTKMYIADRLDDRVYQYDLSTAWDVTTASYYSSISTGSATDPHGVFFKTDGTQMFVTSTNNDRVNVYNLSTPWIVNTASISADYYYVYSDGSESLPTGLFFKPDGTKMYVAGDGQAKLMDYDIGNELNINFPSNLLLPTDFQVTARKAMTIVTTDEGSSYVTTSHTDELT